MNSEEGLHMVKLKATRQTTLAMTRGVEEEEAPVPKKRLLPRKGTGKALEGQALLLKSRQT